MSFAQIVIDYNETTGEVEISVSGEGLAEKLAHHIMTQTTDQQGENFLGMEERIKQ